ncbi:TIM barrel protein [Paenibacillus sp. KQZ6P-2]|uniref:TIM barrel protein n=1 Tax=Paenibacillus mangrovi TaxID=2931978 RepID=A0A9X1WQA2_9BACL|nr:TIM barrel protein [Paenibacillus mangrovi]MCJ8012726.1 TIM barrel protein [Paenibacillus mangrovi]
MPSWNRIHTGTSSDPKLSLQQSWWAMIGIGEQGQEWSIEQKFEKIAEAGYDGIVGFIPSPDEAKIWRSLLERYNLTFGALSFPACPEDLANTIKAAEAFGPVQYINSQVMNSFVIDEQAVDLLNGILETSRRSGIPNFIETHRGTVTQDLIRTVSYVEAIPELRLTIDLSHYVVAGEMNGGSDEAEACFQKLLSRTGAIHARVSNGEQVQIDVGQDGEHPMVASFKRWWTYGFKSWKAGACPGELLPFVTELGPPGYAITRRTDGSDEEISDRWQQALLFKRIAEQLWADVSNEESQETQLR